MKTLLRVLPCTFILTFVSAVALAVSPTPAEIQVAQDFMQSALTSKNCNPPFSFIYDGKSSKEFLSSWKVQRESHALDAQRTQETVTFTDPETGLEVRCVAVRYADFPVVEWTPYFKNTGTKDTPILEKIQAVDINLKRGEKGEFVLHHAKGSQAQIDDFRPLLTTLAPKSDTTITTSGGRPSNSDVPYFNIEWPGNGVILAVGWPGQWAAHFVRDAGDGLRVYAGQQLTHFILHPGEEVRGPLIALLFYQGGWARSQNVWREWMIAHNVPHVDGKVLQPAMFACSSHQFGEMIHAN
ncbi:MAG TPA: hypothetical protein VKA67_01215, partial [Verrucomicrobiae bacterium]|nr:hypothetical protein [Verrucomicrobiae bacterium]